MQRDIKEGKILGVYLPEGIDRMVEDTRKKLGMNRSRFIQYCIMRTLQELNVVTTNIHKEGGSGNG